MVSDGPPGVRVASDQGCRATTGDQRDHVITWATSATSSAPTSSQQLPAAPSSQARRHSLLGRGKLYEEQYLYEPSAYEVVTT